MTDQQFLWAMTELMPRSAPWNSRANVQQPKAVQSIWFTFLNGPHTASCRHRN